MGAICRLFLQYFFRPYSPTWLLVVSLLLQNLIPCTVQQVCNETDVSIANTKLQRQREGHYKMMATRRCRGRPVWIQQKEAGLVNYIFFQRLLYGWSGWIVGTMLCSPEGGISADGDTACPCDPSLTGQWMEASDSGSGSDWTLNTRLTVRCLADAPPSGLKDGSGADDYRVAGPIIGSLTGIFAFGLLVVIIICCCLASQKKSRRNRTTGTVSISVTEADPNNNTVRINTISDHVTRTEPNASLFQLPPYSSSSSNTNGISPPSYNLIDIRTLPTAPPYHHTQRYNSELPPPSYQEVMGVNSQGLSRNGHTSEETNQGVSSNSHTREERNQGVSSNGHTREERNQGVSSNGRTSEGTSEMSSPVF